MPYFLDGNNLIGLARRTSRPSAEERAALISELAERLRHTRARAVLFFDGPGEFRTVTLGSLSIRAAKNASADDQILGELKRSAAPQEVSVVTADRELSRRVREAGGKVVAPEQFWRRFGSDPASPSGEKAQGPVDLEDWIRYFQDEKNRQA